MTYVCFVLNHTYNATIGNLPLTAAAGSTRDISPLLGFSFFRPIYYKIDGSDFPSDTIEEHGYFVSIAESVGHAMTFKILTSNTDEILCRSNMCPANNPTSLII